MTNPLLNRLAKKEHGQRAEKRTAKRLGGRQQPGSGATDHSKGDIKLVKILVENKSTISESLSVKLEWLRKISQEAAEVTREPALAIQFVDAAGIPQKDGKWVMVPERVFLEMTEQHELPKKTRC